MKIRCSSLPRTLQCPASLIPPPLDIRGNEVPADKGVAVHEVMEEIVSKDLTESIPVMAPYLEKWAHLNEDKEIIRLSWNGLYLWNIFRTQFATVLAEDRLEMQIGEKDGEPVILSGQMDLGGKGEDINGVPALYVTDWKTGKVQDTNYWPQTKGYLKLYVNKYGWGECVKARLTTAWLDTRTHEVIEVTPEQLETWYAEELQAKLLGDVFYKPTYDNCEYCPRRYEPCPAKAVMRRATITEWSELDFTDPEKYPPAEVLVQMLPKYYDVVKACKQFFEIIKASIADSGPQETGDGRVAQMIDKTTKTILFQPETYHIIKDTLGDEAFENAAGEIFKITKGKLNNHIVASVPKGKGKAALADFMELLESKGLIETVEGKSFSCKKGKL